jgi:hypothetical protein
MHHKKNITFGAKKLVFALGMFSLALLSACAGHTAAQTSEAVTYEQTTEQKQQMLEKTYADFIAKVEAEVPPESLLVYVTDSSFYWTDTLQRYAQEMSAERVEQLPLGEMLAVLVYRIYDRERAWDPNMNEDYRMLSLLAGKKGVIRRMTNLKLGPFEIKKDRGSVGLASSPKVPVIIFVWDDVSWKLDIKATLPLVTKGLESMGMKKEWSNKELALYLLEKEFHYTYTNIRFDDSLFDPYSTF